MADTEKKRLLVLTADAGFGHRSAANAIEAAPPASQARLVTLLQRFQVPRVE